MGALFEIALIEGALFEIGSKKVLSEDFGSFSMSTNPRRALSEDLVYQATQAIDLWKYRLK